MNMKNFPKRLDSKTSCLRITVPENLDLALEGLIRKVLKEQPKTDDIYSFAANYFETLLKIRDKAGAKFIADQLCPFHNDEDAHEMVKLAGTFSKPDAEKLRKKNEEFLLLKSKNSAINKDPDKEVQDTKYDRKLKSKKKSKDEKAVEQNKQGMSKIIKKLPISVKNMPEESKKQTKLANKRLNYIKLEKNTKKEESDEEEFLASDPIKELVEKELMETKLSGKREEMKENIATDLNTSDELITNKNIHEEQKPVGNNNVAPSINDVNKPLEEDNAAKKENLIEKDDENKSSSEVIEEIEVTKENEIKIENNEVIPEVKEENRGKAADSEEASRKIPEDVEEESAKNKEESNKENNKVTIDIDKNTTNLKIVNKEKTENTENTNRSPENTEEVTIITDKTSDFEISKPEGQPIIQEILSTEEINGQSVEIIKDVTEKDTNTPICSELLGKDNPDDIKHSVKEQEERNVKTPEEIPPNEIKLQVKESNEALNDQQIARVNHQITIEKATKSSTEIASKDENSDPPTENKAVESFVTSTNPSVEKPNAKHDIGEVGINGNHELKAEKQSMTDEEAERTTKIQGMDIRSPKDDEAMEILKKTEEINNDDDVTQDKQLSKITEQVKDLLPSETENEQLVLKNDEKPVETKEAIQDNKNENTTKNGHENGAEVLDSKTKETKLIPEQIINTNENIADTKAESEHIVFQTDSKDNFLKGKPDELNSAYKKSGQNEDKKSETFNPKLLPDTTNPNAVIKSEQKEKPSNEYRKKITEDTLFGEKTYDLEPSIDNECFQTPNEIAVTSQVEKREISETQEDQQNTDHNIAESELKNKKFAAQEEENLRKREDEIFPSMDILNANKPDKEKPNEALKSATPDTNKSQGAIESEKELRKEKSDNQIPYFKVEDKSVQISEGKTVKEELHTEPGTRGISKEDETNGEKPKEKSESENEFKTSSENEEDNLKPEEELCMVIDVQQIPKENAIDRNNLEEKHKPEDEGTQNMEDTTKTEEQTIENETPRIITVEEADKPKENQEILQPSKEIQIKTIQSHYYNTLQVPETVTKEYRVHNVFSSPVSAHLNVASSLQQSLDPKHELLSKEERNEKIVDVNMNSPILVEKVIVPSPAEPTEAVTPAEDVKFDHLQSVGSLKNSKTPANTPNQNELELETQKSDSDDLLDLMTPTSGYSLNLSELSWQTINELFLDSEKRNSSLEKDEIRYVTPKTCKITGESGEQRAPESRQEIEEIFHKTIVSSSIDAVPVPPRDLETNIQTAESVEEKKEEDKPEGESVGNSSDSSNEQISVNGDTPFISVKVKTVIETQILDDSDDDDNENDHIRNKQQKDEEMILPVEIEVKTTIDFGNEAGMTQSESEPKKDKMETTNGTMKNALASSLEIQDKSRHHRIKESSSTEQTTGGEGSSGESDSTISSAATKIKRADFANRNFSSTRSLLSTQSLDLEKKNPLVKTRSLSTFRHGVTDFEVWSTIEKELEEAATKIQSKFRGYKTRKKLQREDAVQITTEESSVSVTPVEEETKNGCHQSTGEFHDSIVLSEHPR